MGFFAPDPEPSSSTFGSIDPSVFGAPIDWNALPFGVPPATTLSFPGLGPSFFARLGPYDVPSAASGWTPPTVVAQTDRKSRCAAMCTAVTLELPPKFRAGTFEQCMAHCEGKGEWPQFEPAIPFGGGK
jgi:hypothetical protein